jgi:hypothetical protein
VIHGAWQYNLGPGESPIRVLQIPRHPDIPTSVVAESQTIVVFGFHLLDLTHLPGKIKEIKGHCFSLFLSLSEPPLDNTSLAGQEAERPRGGEAERRRERERGNRREER